MPFKILFILILSSTILLCEEPWGNDAELVTKYYPNWDPLPHKWGLSLLAESLILFNQHVISPAYGPRSHFRPTSSRYTLYCIRRYGITQGIIMGFDRLLRENDEPWIYRKYIVNDTIYKWEPSFRYTAEIMDTTKNLGKSI